MNILIVDDSKAMRLIVRRVLRQAGYADDSMDEAVNGAEALKSIRAKTPDVVLSDWNMPEMSGIDLLGELAKDGNGVPVVFVTTESTAEMREIAMGSGARALIAKPFDAEQLRTVLESVLKRS